MSHIEKISDSQYKVGQYHVIQSPKGRWKIIGEEGSIALFYQKHDALAWANLHYTCGDLVSDGVGQLLTLALEENE